MSFIYAHKFGNTIRIMSDTKPTIASNEMLKLQNIHFENIFECLFVKSIFSMSNKDLAVIQ